MSRDRRPVDVKVNGAIRRRFYPSISDVRELVKQYLDLKNRYVNASAHIKWLLEVISDQKTTIARSQVPYGHCPYAYNTMGKNRVDIDCNEIGCDQCKINYWKEYEEAMKKITVLLYSEGRDVPSTYKEGK